MVPSSVHSGSPASSGAADGHVLAAAADAVVEPAGADSESDPHAVSVRASAAPATRARDIDTRVEFTATTVQTWPWVTIPSTVLGQNAPSLDGFITQCSCAIPAGVGAIVSSV